MGVKGTITERLDVILWPSAVTVVLAPFTADDKI